MENGKKPIYPSKGYRHTVLNEGETQVGDGGFMQFHGLTKREYFAAMAMQGLLACPNLSEEKGEVTNQIIANESVYLADRLLKALETIKSE